MSQPHYVRLAETLLSQIGDGTIAVGDRLPTEAKLGETHDLARGTVRRALGRLEQLGMIDRRARAGTTVISAVPVPPYQPVAQSAADIATLATETRLLRPEMGELVLDAKQARRLGTRAGSEWFRIQGCRVRRKQGSEPLCWSEHYIRAESDRRGLLSGEVDLDQLSGHRTQQTVSAALLEPQMAKALGAEPFSAALVITRRHFDGQKKLGAVGIHTHPADRYSITTTVNTPPTG
jgi:GntR family transcriptional regulator